MDDKLDSPKSGASILRASPHPLFDPHWYASQNSGIRAEEATFGHYLTEGWRQRKSPHPLFSVEFYLFQREDVTQAGFEPLTHFIINGWKEGTSPCPLFDIKYYLEQAGDIGCDDPLTHYLRIGRRLGLRTHRYFDSSYYCTLRGGSDVGSEDSLSDFFEYGWKAGLAPSALISLTSDYNVAFMDYCIALLEAFGEADQRYKDVDRRAAIRKSSLVTWIPEAHDNPHVLNMACRILESIYAFEYIVGNIEYVFALNFYAGGGAEWATLGYIDQICNRSFPCILILTDNGPRRPVPKLPREVMIIDLSELFPGSSYAQRSAILFLILKNLHPKVLHIVNSEVAWYLLRDIPNGFFTDMNVLASVFALQFADAEYKNLVGYAVQYLPNMIEKLRFVITDNRRFASEAPSILKIDTHKDKFVVVYNRSKLEGEIDYGSTLLMLSGRIADLCAASRLRVIWAGRLDAEKRVDLLFEIAAASVDFCDFYVHGDSVVDGESSILNVRLPTNIKTFGAYATPEEWDKPALGHVFLFTSRWEGMPNALIEASHLGYPIVATDVGGVAELITDETGWAIDKSLAADAYVATFRQIWAEPDIVLARGVALSTLVHQRHSGAHQRAHFNAVLESVL